MREMTKHTPFLEVLASSVKEDYRFPILEIFAFLYTLATFVFASISGIGEQYVVSKNAVAFGLIYSLTRLTLVILTILMLKNIAYGLGKDLNNGLMQTYLAYPLKRRSFLAAKLFSSLGIALLLFVGIQLVGLFILSPDILSEKIDIVLVSYAGVLGNPLFIVSLALILSLFLKSGSSALLLGMIAYFASGILTLLVQVMAMVTSSSLPLKVLAVVDPVVALQRHYTGGFPEELWVPTLNGALMYVGACYALVTLVFIAGFLYFERRLEV